MARKGFLLILLILLLVAGLQATEFKKNVKITLLTDAELQNYLIKPSFSTAEYCTVKQHDSVAWGVTHWVIGNELYKSYQDPGVSCGAPYPYSIEKIYFVLLFEQACSIFVSVDVEAADLTTPSCPVPGTLLDMSTTYQVNIPGPGLYQIETPLDSPLVVNEPYFAGFFFADYVDSAWGVSIITDDTPIPCVNYNIWDTTIGFVDLTNTGFPSFPSFPGRMLLFSAGTTGGSGGVQPEPSITILKPGMNEAVTGIGKIWAVETAGSDIIESVQFHYRGSGVWYSIGYDYDGFSPMRNGVSSSGAGDGWAIDWDYTALNEGDYWLRATVFDTLGRFAIDSVQVSVDPTPPDPILTNPPAMESICLPQTLVATSIDEDLTDVKFEKKNASLNYQAPVITLNQFNYGDNDGDPFDGNSADSGEYGDYYCGPTAGAIAVKYWFDQGYIYSMREGTQYLSVDTVVERLAANMLTRSSGGTHDDLFYSGLLQYIATHGNELQLNLFRDPDYHEFRTLLQEREQLLILGLSGVPGLYLVGAGVSGLADEFDKFAIKVSDPITGTIADTYIRNSISGCEVEYDGVWHDLDVIITVIGSTHTVSREFIAADNSASGGWSHNWISSDMVEDSLYFVSATASDASGRAEIISSLIEYKCSLDYPKGDYNDDGVVNIGDALYLSEFIYEYGPIPVGGAGRADANCDSNIDISDVIFMIRYIFEGGSEPCY